MTWYQGLPQTSGSLDSLPIRDNFDFLKVGLDVHASSSANPHSTTLQQATDSGASTTNPITVTASGSVVKSLRVQNNLLVGDEFSQHGNNVYINKNGPDWDQYIYFYNSGSPTGAHLKYDDEGERFEFNRELYVTGGPIETSATSDINSGRDLKAAGSIYINSFGADDDAILYFVKPGSGNEDLRWNKTTEQFEFSNKINVATSGSVLKSLRVQNNELVGGNLEVKGILKALDWIELKPELAALGDGSTNNNAAQLALYTSTDADVPNCRHWTLRFDDTTREHAYWDFFVPVNYVNGGRLKLQFYMESAQTSIKYLLGFRSALQAITPNVDNTDMFTLDLTNEGGNWVSGSYTLTSATAGILQEMTINMASNLNSMAAGDLVILGLQRDALYDKANGDCSLITARFEYNY